MDIYNHLVENIANASKKETKQLPDKKFYVPRDLKDIQKQKYYKEKQNKNAKQVVGFEKSHIIFQRPWKELNKAQKMNRIIAYAKQNNLEQQPLLLAFEKRKIEDINYNISDGMITELILKE